MSSQIKNIIFKHGCNSLQTLERHDGVKHSPMREGKRIETDKEIVENRWNALSFSVDGITAGKLIKSPKAGSLLKAVFESVTKPEVI
jgi:hypothetical protein